MFVLLPAGNFAEAASPPSACSVPAFEPGDYTRRLPAGPQGCRSHCGGPGRRADQKRGQATACRRTPLNAANLFHCAAACVLLPRQRLRRPPSPDPCPQWQARKVLAIIVVVQFPDDTWDPDQTSLPIHVRYLPYAAAATVAATGAASRRTAIARRPMHVCGHLRLCLGRRLRRRWARRRALPQPLRTWDRLFGLRCAL